MSEELHDASLSEEYSGMSQFKESAGHDPAISAEAHDSTLSEEFETNFGSLTEEAHNPDNSDFHNPEDSSIHDAALSEEYRNKETATS
jgi:hypothetical protein